MTGVSFNPHTHAGCDAVAAAPPEAGERVSIHTPTQGVTLVNLQTQGALTVSIHTPTQGVTLVNLQTQGALTVSIHTPTQGVTVDSIKEENNFVVSIHTPTQGVTQCDYCVHKKSKFQSTHPRRV